MTWFKLDDKLWGSAVWAQLPKSARALYSTAASWSSDQLTDGFVPRHMLKKLDGTQAEAHALCMVGGVSSLWTITDGGWTFRDWAKDQPTRDKVEEERESARQRQAKARERARESRVSHAVTNGEVHPLVTVPPTRPDPSLEVLTELHSRAKARGTRISADYQPSADMLTRARSDFPSVDLRVETDSFRGYWMTKPGKDAVKLDWDITWTNWMRKTHQRNQERKVTNARPRGGYA